MELNDVCDLIVDCEHKTAPTQATGYPSIRTPNIGRGYFILDGVKRVSEETYLLWTRRAVPQPGDLIMAREAPVGNVAVVPQGLQPCLGQRTLLIRPNRARVDPAFLSYLLNGPVVQSLIQAKTNGVTVPHLNMEDVRSMQLPALPSLCVQRRIAGVLTAYDELAENCQTRIGVLEAMTRSVYREWCVKYRAPGNAGFIRPASAPGKVPAGWDVVRLEDMCRTVQDGDWVETRDQGGSSYRLVQISNIGVGEFVETGNHRFITQETFDRLRCNEVVPDDILVARMPDPIGRAWLVTEMPWRMITAVDVAILRAREDVVLPGFLALAWNDSSNLQRIAAHASGTTRPRVTRRELVGLEFLIPPLPLQVRLMNVCEPHAELIETLRRRADNLRQTRDLLLPRLLSGQIKLDAA